MTVGHIDELQRKLAASEEALRRCEERNAAGQLALELMHELKNPLETLGHLTYLALEESDPETVKDYLRQANEQMRMLGEIASQTLGFARVIKCAATLARYFPRPGRTPNSSAGDRS
jgi:signal transduction histidine kinase